MFRGGVIYWLVFIVSFLPFVLYQNAMRDGDVPQLDPLGVGAFAALTPIIGWFVARNADDAFSSWLRSQRNRQEMRRVSAPSPRAVSIYNPLTWERRHKVAFAMSTVIGLVVALFAGYQWGDPTYQLSDWLFHFSRRGPPECTPWALLGIFVGGSLFYVLRISAR